MDSIIAQIRTLAETASEVGRLEIQKALWDIQLEIQSPKDVFMELANSVSPNGYRVFLPQY